MSIAPRFTWNFIAAWKNDGTNEYTSGEYKILKDLGEEKWTAMGPGGFMAEFPYPWEAMEFCERDAEYHRCINTLAQLYLEEAKKDLDRYNTTCDLGSEITLAEHVEAELGQLTDHEMPWNDAVLFRAEEIITEYRKTTKGGKDGRD